MALLLTVALSTMAMSYEQARDRALFLTDKMAYELNLNDEQYEAAYEVNLDYLMSISTYDDLYGTYWTRRNMDLSYILFDWQYNAFCSAAYFYRPLIWTNGVWRFSIYVRYPNRTYSISADRHSMPHTTADTAGTETADAAGITDAPSDLAQERAALE